MNNPVGHSPIDIKVFWFPSSNRFIEPYCLYKVESMTDPTMGHADCIYWGLRFCCRKDREGRWILTDEAFAALDFIRAEKLIRRLNEQHEH